jgi:hypothetical protein
MAILQGGALVFFVVVVGFFVMLGLAALYGGSDLAQRKPARLSAKEKRHEAYKAA